MREVIREIFAGVYAPFTGRILAGIAVLPVLFSLSIGANSSVALTNIVDESAIYEEIQEDDISTEEDIIEVKEPDAGNSQATIQAINVNQKISTPIDIAESAPISYDLAISGKIATNVVNVGLNSKGAVAVPDYSAGYYSTGGAHLLVGHNTGVFAGLTSVAIGDTIDFWGASYRVYGSKVYEYDPNLKSYNDDGSYTKNGTMMYESMYNGGSTGLNLMTCFGSYLPSHGTWDHRYVVFASKI